MKMEDRAMEVVEANLGRISELSKMRFQPFEPLQGNRKERRLAAKMARKHAKKFKPENA